MKRTAFVLMSALLLALAWSCASEEQGNAGNDEKAVIAEFLKEDSRDQADIEVTDLAFIQEVTVLDSLNYLQPLFDAQKQAKVAPAVQEINRLKTRITSNSLSSDSVQYLQERISRLEQRVATLRGDCKGTLLEPIYNRLQRLNRLPNEQVIAQEYDCEYRKAGAGELLAASVFLTPDKAAVDRVVYHGPVRPGMENDSHDHDSHSH